MITKTVISYLPGSKKRTSRKKKKDVWGGFIKYGKFVLLFLFIGIFLIYTNQSSTLGYSLRKSFQQLEKTQEQYDAIQLLVSKKEQAIRSQIERKSNKKQSKKIIVE